MASLKIVLETERLMLREWVPDDLEPFAEMNADPEVMAFFVSPLDRAGSDGFARKISVLMEQNGYGLWAVEEKASGLFAGFTGFHPAGFDSWFTPCTEIGWRLARPFWNRGYATEAASAALRYGFETLRLPVVHSFTSRINIRSIRVMEKIGLRYLGDFDHPAIEAGNPLRTHVVYKSENPAGI